MKNQLNAIIVEDNLQARKALNNLLSENCPEVTIAGESEDIPTAKQLIDKLRPDLLFLDIELKGQLVFDLLTQLQ